jgi:ABC-type proline/glycine betaine transport system permease subunit
MISQRLLAAVIVVALGLLALVIAVGLWRGDLDTTTVAAVLAPLVSGIVVGAALRKDKADGGEDA